jgi:hypothetical protein
MKVRYSRGRRVLWRQTSDRVLLLPADDGELVSLTGTGLLLWELLAEPMELMEIADFMSATYGVTTDVVESDLVPVLDDLGHRGLIELAG